MHISGYRNAVSYCSVCAHIGLETKCKCRYMHQGIQCIHIKGSLTIRGSHLITTINAKESSVGHIYCNKKYNVE